KVVDAVASNIGSVNRCSARLADIEEAPQAMSLGSYIAHLQHGSARDLLLDVQIVVLHVRCLDVAVEAEGIALKTARCGRRIDRTAGDDSPANRARRQNCCGPNVVIGRT